MNTQLQQRCTRSLAVVAIITSLAACTEPSRRLESSAVEPALEARLDLSSAQPQPDAEVSVTVQLRGSAARSVASFTVRVAYDTASLRFLGETDVADGAQRLANPQPGMLRIAGIAPEGFKDGRLYVARFGVLRANAANSLKLLVDEMHTIANADVAATVQGAP